MNFLAFSTKKKSSLNQSLTPMGALGTDTEKISIAVKNYNTESGLSKLFHLENTYLDFEVQGPMGKGLDLQE